MTLNVKVLFGAGQGDLWPVKCRHARLFRYVVELSVGAGTHALLRPIDHVLVDRAERVEARASAERALFRFRLFKLGTPIEQPTAFRRRLRVVAARCLLLRVPKLQESSPHF